jgi:hypothetical protein
MKQLTSMMIMLLLLTLPALSQAQDEEDMLPDPADPVSPEPEPVEEPLPDSLGASPGEDYTEDPDVGAEEDATVTEEATAAETGGTTIGLGIATTLAGAVGGEAEFWIGDKLLITALLGITYFNPDVDGADATTGILLAGGGFYRLAGGDGTDFMLGGRLDLGSASGGRSQINLEIPARVEHRFTDSMSIHFETGFVLGLISEDGAVTAPFGPADSRVMQLGGGLFGSAGITLYVL